MKHSMAIRAVGSIGIFAYLFALGSVLIAILLAGNTFSWNRNALSDLGVSTISLVANVFNVSLVLAGLLNLVFAVGFTKASAKNSLSYLGGLLLILGGISLSLIGVFTEAYGRLHFYVSAGYFGFSSLAIIINGLAFHKDKQTAKGTVSILAGLITAFVMLSGTTLKWHILLGLGFAVLESIASFMFAAWTIWMSYHLVATNG